jgi:hypothetical protein
LPPNDQFDDRIQFTGRTNTVTGSNVYATKERHEFYPFGPSEPDHAGNVGGKSLWWEWTATETAFVTIDTFGSSFDTLLAVYLDYGDVFSLEEVVSNDDSGSDLRSRVKFLARAETTYVIAVDGFAGASGNVVLTLRQPTPTPPANDNFANSITIAGTDITFSGNNVAATREPGEPRHYRNINGHSVWWKWTAPITGEVSISDRENSFDSVAAVYTGNSVSNLSRVAENYIAFGGVFFRTKGGATYYIAVDGNDDDIGDFVLNLKQTPYPPEPPLSYNSGSSFQEVFVGDEIYLDQIILGGTFPMHIQWFKDGTAVPGATNSVLVIRSAQLNDAGSYVLRATNNFGDTEGAPIAVTVHTRPANDNFANRFPLNGTSISVLGTNNGASKEPGEPDHAFNIGGKSVWWTWTAPAAGNVSIVVSNSVFDSFYKLLGVYVGGSVSNLALVGFAQGFQSALSFSTVGGATYQIAVDGNRKRPGFSG